MDDNLAKLNIWSLHDSSRADLIESVLDPDDLQRTVAVIVLSLESPLKMMEQLRDWFSALSN